MEQDVYHLFLEGVTMKENIFKDIHELLAVCQTRNKDWQVGMFQLQIFHISFPPMQVT